MHNHYLLQLTGKPSWLTIEGGRCVFFFCSSFHSHFTLCSKTYVDKIVSGLDQNQLHLSSPVVSLKIREQSSRVIEIMTSNGISSVYDHAILACHSDTALGILEAGGATLDEQIILGQFTWNKNRAVLHCDTTVCAALSAIDSDLLLVANAQKPPRMVRLELS